VEWLDDARAPQNHIPTFRVREDQSVAMRRSKEEKFGYWIRLMVEHGVNDRIHDTIRPALMDHISACVWRPMWNGWTMAVHHKTLFPPFDKVNR
jgi:hypothetical protein